VLHSQTTQTLRDPKNIRLLFFFHPTAGYQSGTATDPQYRHKGPKAQKGPTLSLARPAAASHHSSPPRVFFYTLLRTHARRSAARPFSRPPNFPPFSDGDIIAIWKIPPRTLRSLTDPDYAQLPAIALAIGRFVFRGCDCLKLGWAIERVSESEREAENSRGKHTQHRDKCCMSGQEDCEKLFFYTSQHWKQNYAGAI
jgi:hypothetical protein